MVFAIPALLFVLFQLPVESLLSRTVVHWIDLFSRAEYCNILINTLSYGIGNNGLNIHAWVIMPSHFHAIVSTNDVQLQTIFQGVKSYSSREIIKEIERIN